MLAGNPKFPSRFWSPNTITAANSACSSTGRTIAAWIAPLMKRKTSGHLHTCQLGCTPGWGRAVRPTFVVFVGKSG